MAIELVNGLFFSGKSYPETIDFPISYGAFRFQFSQQNQSIESGRYEMLVMFSEVMGNPNHRHG